MTFPKNTKPTQIEAAYREGFEDGEHHREATADDGWFWSDTRAALSLPSQEAEAAPVDHVGGIDWNNPNDPVVKLFVGFDVEDYVEDYELRGAGGDYTPNEQEKTLITDAVYGVIGNLHEELRKLIPSPLTAVSRGTPAAWLFEGDGWGREIMLSEQETRERKERLSHTWKITITPLYALAALEGSTNE